MIVDLLDNHRKIKGFPEITEAFEFLRNLPPNVEDGRINISENIFVGISSYTTIPFEKGKLESHKKYIDIQVLLSGTEQIGWNHVSALTPSTEYNGEKDVVFYSTPSKFSNFTTLTPALFMIFFPDDGHMPQIMLNTPEQVRKAVFKIVVN